MNKVSKDTFQQDKYKYGFVTDIESKISPQIEKMIEQGGYVKKSKYENLERIISDLEDRLDKLEKKLKLV